MQQLVRLRLRRPIDWALNHLISSRVSDAFSVGAENPLWACACIYLLPIESAVIPSHSLIIPTPPAHTHRQTAPSPRRERMPSLEALAEALSAAEGGAVSTAALFPLEV